MHMMHHNWSLTDYHSLLYNGVPSKRFPSNASLAPVDTHSECGTKVTWLLVKRQSLGQDGHL